MRLHATGLGLFIGFLSCQSQKLDPGGQNVCIYQSDPTSHVCCSGWKQEGTECTTPLCEGKSACQPNAMCVFPGFCRCKPSYYGAGCRTQCPPEFWGPDCMKLCQCHPHGRCHPETGKCTCHSGRWGTLCQNVCRCGRHGQCNPTYGNCTCDEGWWTSTCSKACLCHPTSSTCDPVSGRCLCKEGYWGPRCTQLCQCSGFPCQQQTGACVCPPSLWGPRCDHDCRCDLKHGRCSDNGDCLCEPGYRAPTCGEPCNAGFYGNGCKKVCGHCHKGQPCTTVDGLCIACDPGWNGTRCDQRCPPGYHGHLCRETCPRCHNGEPCDPESGECSRCEPGWAGPRCSVPCPKGTFGDGCRYPCGPCVSGHCDHVTGSCVCQPGFQGKSCNASCPAHLYGVNCSSACDCGSGGCHPASGECRHSGRGALIAAIIIPLLVLLVLLFCCCCYAGGGRGGGGGVDGKDRVAVQDGGPAVRMKHQVYGVLADVGSAVPCLTLWSSGLPRVTVSHHDPELTFNHSFIEPPSSGWVSGSSSSFESDDAEAIYCVPPREDISPLGGDEFQEMTSKCNMFLDPSGFSGEDASQSFSIPRTSSIAKAKRPSVSFAEGTKFTPTERRGSSQDGACMPRKSKSPRGVLMLSALQSQGDNEGVGEAAEVRDFPSEEPPLDGDPRDADSERPGVVPSRTGFAAPGGRRRTMSNTRQHVQPQGSADSEASDPDKITTVYVTAGEAGCPAKTGLLSEGPVQAVLRRLGSLQKQCGQAVSKPPRRKLGARVTMWEDATQEPSQRRGTADARQQASVPKRPTSSVLMSVQERPAPNLELASDTGYLTIGPMADSVTSDAEEEPNYENVLVKAS